jgi:hypothetical protein
MASAASEIDEPAVFWRPAEAVGTRKIQDIK